MPKTVMIIGADGFLGRYLIKSLLRRKNLSEIYAADIAFGDDFYSDNRILRLEIDIGNNLIVEKRIKDYGPDIIILTAAITNVDYCETHPDKSFEINAYGPKYVAESCSRIGAKLIYISTDFVFDGKKGNYRENDLPNPINIYGKSKLKGEVFIENSGIDAFICRTSVLFGWPSNAKKTNFFYWAYNSLIQGKSLNIIKGQITTPTLVDDLAEFLSDLALKSDPKGVEILHTAGAQAINRYEFVRKIAIIFGLNEDLIHPIENIQQKAHRPANSSLNTEKVKRMDFYSFHDIDYSLNFLKNNPRIGIKW